MIYYIGRGDEIFSSTNIKTANIGAVLDYFKDKKIIEVDTETELNKRIEKHLANPYECKLLCIQLGDKDNQFVINPKYVDLSPIYPLFEDPNKLKLFCNAFFDLRFIYYLGVKIKNIYDIFLAECILYKGLDLPKGFRSLAQISSRYLGEEISKEVRNEIQWRGLDEEVIKYSAGDVSKLARIREEQLKEIDRKDLRRYLDMENRYVLSLAKVSYKGFKCDPVQWMGVYNENKIKVQQLESTLNSWALDYCLKNNKVTFLDNTLFGVECNISWTSPIQVKKFFDELGIDIIDKKTKKETVDIKLLKKQLEEFEILKIYVDYKETQKEISTYGEQFLIDNINPITNRIHSEFYQILDTSRISSNNPNLQNIPAEREGETHPLRKAFIPEEGNTLIVCDFSQQEPRITAEYSQDPYLIDFILNGDGDSHSLIATMISEYLLGEHIKVDKHNNPMVASFGKPIRSIGKIINLGKDLII